jgi:nitroimidazol reductase NimA-like FMN-containing flavoprotein (pyridoxamine 5'-phosphate oxidase superfamily)
MNLKTEMRRSEKAIQDLKYVESILEEAPVGIFSSCKDNTPYVIPVNFYYENNSIYIHSAQEGQKVLYVKANPRVCFLILHPVDVQETECHGAMNYESVLCFGRAEFCKIAPREMLSKLGKKYGECSDILEEERQKTALIKIEIEEISAKRGY